MLVKRPTRMISAAACRAFHGAAAGVGAAIKQTTRRDTHRREVDEERHRAVSLSRTLLRAKSVVTNRNLVPRLVSFLARPERPVQAARRRLPPHTAGPPLAAFARPHPLASPAASCLRDAEQRCFSRVTPRDHRAGWRYPPPLALHRISRQAFARRRPARGGAGGTGPSRGGNIFSFLPSSSTTV